MAVVHADTANDIGYDHASSRHLLITASRVAIRIWSLVVVAGVLHLVKGTVDSEAERGGGHSNVDRSAPMW